MDNVEKYGVELEAITEPFKNKMKDLENTSKKIGQEIKNNLNIKDAITFNELENKISTYSNKIKELTNQLAKLKEEQKRIEWFGGDTDNLDIELVENKIETLGNTIDKLNNKKIDILNREQLSAHIEELEKRLINLKRELKEEETKTIWESETSKLLNLREVIRETSQEILLAKDRFNSLEDVDLNKMTKDVGEANEELSWFNKMILEIKQTSSNLGDNISKGFSRTIKSIKRLTLSLVGVHSAYYVLSRAISTYQQYDIETTNKMKSAWAGLGAFLAPLVQTIGTLVQKAVGYLNVFITALTGVDYVKKANDAYKYSKSVKAIGSSAKEASKSLTAMDEITNIPEASSGGGAGGGIDDFNPFEMLEQVELDQEWVKKIKEIAEALKPVYNTIKDIVKWCVDHPDIVASMLGGIALLSLLGKIIGYAGTGTATGVGLAGILGILLAIAGLTIITISIKLVWENAKKTYEANETVSNMADNLANKYKQAREEFEKLIKAIEKDDPKIKEIFDDSINKVGEIKNNLKELREEKEKLINPNSKEEGFILGNLFKDFWYEFGGDRKRQEKMFYTSIQESYTYLNNLKLLYDQGKLNEEQTEQYKQTLQEFTSELDKAGYGSEDVRKEFKLNEQQTKELSDMYGTAKTSLKEFGDSSKTTSDTIKTNTDNIKSDINSIPTNKKIKVDVDTKSAGDKLKALGGVLNLLKPNWLVGGFTSLVNQLRSYDVGTPYVPEDGIAMIHKGERIIPAKYNNENLFNNNSNETTNALLVELIQAVEENGDKVPIFNINGREFARATYNDMQEEAYRLNQNTTIRRV